MINIWIFYKLNPSYNKVTILNQWHSYNILVFSLSTWNVPKISLLTFIESSSGIIVSCYATWHIWSIRFHEFVCCQPWVLSIHGRNMGCQCKWGVSPWEKFHVKDGVLYYYAHICDLEGMTILNKRGMHKTLKKI